MTSSIEALLTEWDGEAVATRYDADHGAYMFIGVHSTILGPTAGGTRIKVYPRPADGLADCMRLAEAMTFKFAVAGLEAGGGKAVLAVPEIPTGAAKRDLLLRYADLIETLNGTYRTGPDMNTTQADMDVIGERTRHVFGRSPENGGCGSSAPDTAVGVYHGIQASCAHVFGSGALTGRTVLVQGLGGVGRVLVDLLARDGAKLLVADVDAGRVAEVVQELGAVAVPPDEVIGTECDVFAPCATGGVLDATTIPRLRCPIVAGAANNQLAERADANRLTGAGILYAPDFVINSGGALHLFGLELLNWSTSELAGKLAGIGDTLGEIYTRASEHGTSTEEAAEAIARARIEAARRQHRPHRTW
ncbi:MAG: Glu/Leu/Phe/Val dehydrogenase dimerization domain-containing protein [Mycobacteriales bacterium]|jgi:leucine dehydrogenase